MIDLCQDINLPETTDCDSNWANKPIDEVLKRQIELHLQYNPEYRFDRLEFKYEDGIHTVTPVYKHKFIQ